MIFMFEIITLTPFAESLGPIQPSDIGANPLDVSLWIGLVAPFIVGVLTRAKWKQQVKFWITIGIVVILTIFAWWTTSYPLIWELIATQFVTIFGVSQMVYNILKPTGLFNFTKPPEYKPKHALEE